MPPAAPEPPGHAVMTKRLGITLIELLLAIGLALVLSGIVLPAVFTGLRERAFESTVEVVRNQFLLDGRFERALAQTREDGRQHDTAEYQRQADCQQQLDKGYPEPFRHDRVTGRFRGRRGHCCPGRRSPRPRQSHRRRLEDDHGW